ncbi:MAG: hypothetical protein SVM80_11745 [Halobacteriota archaeon]|nr:hypothetical protein [Halobacteriota archaeon]
MRKITFESAQYPAHYEATKQALQFIDRLKLDPDVFIKNILKIKGNDLIKLRAIFVFFFLREDEALTREQISEIFETNTSFVIRVLEPLLTEEIPLLRKDSSGQLKKRVGRPRKNDIRKAGRNPYMYSGGTKLKKLLSDPSDDLLELATNLLIISNDNKWSKEVAFQSIRIGFGIPRSKNFPKLLEFCDREIEEFGKVGERMRRYAPKTGSRISDVSKFLSEFRKSSEFENNICEIKNIDIEQYLVENDSLIEERIDEIDGDPVAFITHIFELVITPYISEDILKEIVDYWKQ